MCGIELELSCFFVFLVLGWTEGGTLPEPPSEGKQRRIKRDLKETKVRFTGIRLELLCLGKASPRQLRNLKGLKATKRPLRHQPAEGPAPEHLELLQSDGHIMPGSGT